MSNRITSQIQHAIQYPSGHLDRMAHFGPVFEMTSDRPEPAQSPAISADRPVEQPSKPADQPSTPLADPRRFITAGKATFTLAGVQARYTYRVNRSDPGPDNRTVLFVSLLTGPDNTSDYTYLGLLDEQTGAIRLTRKSRYTDQTQPVVALRWVCARLWRGISIDPARIYHEGRCARCGRALTVPASIESGFGPECLARMEGD